MLITYKLSIAFDELKFKNKKCMKNEKKAAIRISNKQIQVKTSFCTDMMTGQAITHLLIGTNL